MAEPVGIKQSQLRPCSVCGRGVMHSNQITFYRVTCEHFVVMTNAVKRQHGLEMAMGNAVLAAVMGPDEDMAKRAGDGTELILCQHCAIHGGCFAQILEAAAERAAESEEAAQP